MTRPASGNRRELLRGGAVLGLAGAAGIASAAPGIAQEAAGGKLAEILDRGRLIVGTGTAGPPFHYEGEDGRLAGFEIDIARYLARGLFGLTDAEMADPAAVDARLELVVETLDERIPNVLSGKVDIVCQFMSVTPARALEVEFTIPYYRDALTLLLPPWDGPASVAELAGTGATVGIVEVASAIASVRQGVPDAEVRTYATVGASIDALDAGEVDAAAVDLSTAQYAALRKPGAYRIAADSLTVQTFGMAVAPGDQRWLNWVNACLHELLVGVDFQLYRNAFGRAFGMEPPAPGAGFPVEFR